MRHSLTEDAMKRKERNPDYKLKKTDRFPITSQDMSIYLTAHSMACSSLRRHIGSSHSRKEEVLLLVDKAEVAAVEDRFGSLEISCTGTVVYS